MTINNETLKYVNVNKLILFLFRAQVYVGKHELKKLVSNALFM